MKIRAAEISKIIQEQIESFDSKVEVKEVGTVLSIGDGIARVYGLDKVMAGELVTFPDGTTGMVLNLEMEMSTYLTLAAVSTYRVRAGGVCLVLNNRITGQGLTTAHARRRAERRLIDVGLQALTILAAEDQREQRF